MERAHVPYFLGGSLASSLQGEPRSTNGIDFVVDLRAPQVQPLEDSVLRKLMWFRDGGETSTSQWRDIVQVLRVSAGKLDASYLEEWAGGLGVVPLLAKAREAAG